jgi:mannosyl-3-phosphoglycerate phosphatase
VLRRQGIPLVIVTSKTRAEVTPLHKSLRLRAPFVVENGGAAYIPAGYFPFPIKGAEKIGSTWFRLAPGTPRPVLVKALVRAARLAAVSVKSFSQMSADEVARFSGLGRRQARLACQREFDEPFVILTRGPRAWPRLRVEIHNQGLRATRGSRFFHILGRNNKGAAVRRVSGWLRRLYGREIRTVALGDSPNDIPMLRAVDMPIVVALPNGRYDAETLAAVPHARRAGGIGPVGWNRAVLRLLSKGSA